MASSMSPDVAALVRRLRTIGYSEERIARTIQRPVFDVWAELNSR